MKGNLYPHKGKTRIRPNLLAIAFILVASLILASFATSFALGEDTNPYLPHNKVYQIKSESVSEKSDISSDPENSEFRSLGARRSLGEPVPVASKSIFGRGNLPVSATIDMKCLPPVGYQGKQGSCVGWTVGYYYKTYIESREHGWNPRRKDRQFSPSWIYNQVNEGVDSGASFASAFRLLMNSGIVDIEEFPYDENNYKKQPDYFQREAAKPYRIKDFYALWLRAGGNDITMVKSMIAAGMPVALCIPVYSSFYNCSTGLVDSPRASEEYLGDHAVLAVGYDDRAFDGRGGVRIINSWGTSWGSSGFAYLSYEFMSDYCWEAWVMNDRLQDRPIIRRVDPGGGRAGTHVVLRGENFGAKRRLSKVCFGGASATVIAWKDSYIKAIVPDKAQDSSLFVYNWAGETSNKKEFYLDITLREVNPGVARAGEPVVIYGVGLGNKPGEVRLGTRKLDVLSWSDNQVVFRAPMESCSGRVAVYAEKKASNSLPFAVAEKTWYIAEGSTAPGFETWILIQNPNDKSARVSIRYMTPSGPVQGPTAVIPPYSRKSFNVADTVPSQFEVSTEIRSSIPVVAERSMYGGERTWAHSSAAVSGDREIGVL